MMPPRKPALAIVPAAPSANIAFVESPLGRVLAGLLADGSPSYSRIAEYLMRNPMRVAALKIDEMAEGCRVSTATISRFARDIGFTTYASMRSAVAETLHSALQPVDKLRHTIEHRNDLTCPGDESMEYAVVNIAATRNSLQQQELDQVVRKLSGARTVYVLGFGISSYLAGLMVLHLQPFCCHVVEVAGPGGTEVAAGHLVNIGPRDVLVVMSFPRYALDVIRLAQFARSHEACVVSITDAPTAPMVELSDHVLYASAGHAVLPSSATAAVAVIEALVMSLMVSNKDNVDKAARLSKAVASYLIAPGDGKTSKKIAR